MSKANKNKAFNQIFDKAVKLSIKLIDEKRLNDEMEERIEELNHRIKQLETKEAELNLEINLLKTQACADKLEIQSLNQTIKELGNDRSEIRNYAENLLKEYEQAKKDYERLSNVFCALLNLHKGLQIRTFDLINENNHLKNQFVSLNKELNKTYSEKEDLISAIADCESEINAAQAIMEDLILVQEAQKYHAKNYPENIRQTNKDGFFMDKIQINLQTPIESY